MLLWLAHPPADLGPLAFVALFPLWLAARRSSPGRALLLGAIFGLVYFGLLMSWLLPLTRIGWFVLAGGQAVGTALLAAFVAAVWREDAPIRTALGVAAGWTTLEWARGVWPLGGFAWGGLGTTQHDNPLLLPLASILGTWGVGFAVAAAGVLLLFAAGRVGEWRVAARPAALALALVVLPVAIPLPAPAGPKVRVAVVQGNVPEDLATESRLIEDRIVAENHARLHLGLADDPPDLAVWPENALDQDPTRDPFLRDLVTGAVRTVGVPTLVGAITGSGGRLFNENLLYDGEGAVVGRYVKNHLVPFGEYVPARDFFERWIQAVRQVRADLTPGTEPGRFLIPGGSFASVICFENAFPDLVREYVTSTTGFLVVSTNDATFGRSPASDQHLALSEMRAVETGRWVVHAAISGKSGIIDQRGRLVASTGLFEPALLRAAVPQAEGRTIFGLIGGWLPAAFALGAALAFIRPRRRPARPVGPLPLLPHTVVVLPTYDEGQTIEEILRGVLAAGEWVEVVVVDDSSPDGTAALARRVEEEMGRVTVVERSGKQGLASAYRDGFEVALGRGADVVVEMDADGSHLPEDLPRLLEGARDHHLVIGSRYVPGGAIPDWSLGRRMLSRGGNLYARLLLGLPVADATSGYRAYRRDALAELLAGGIHADGYAFQIELAYRAWRSGLSVGEVPITFTDRRHGHSKLSRRIVVEALWKVLVWGIRDRVLLRPPPIGAGASPGTSAGRPGA